MVERTILQRLKRIETKLGVAAQLQPCQRGFTSDLCQSKPNAKSTGVAHLVHACASCVCWDSTFVHTSVVMCFTMYEVYRPVRVSQPHAGKESSAHSVAQLRGWGCRWPTCCGRPAIEFTIIPDGYCCVKVSK